VVGGCPVTMTYFEARRAECVLKQYRDLAFCYWKAKPKREPMEYEWMAGRQPDPESLDSISLRERLNRLYPKVSVFAQHLGVPTQVTSYPAPAIGGPVIHGDLLNCVIDQRIGHSSVSKAEVVDAMDKCIGMAQNVQEHLFWKQAVNPLYYLIMAAGFVLRIPFLILEEAGLPHDAEKSVWGHIFKVLEFVALAWVGLHYGLKIDAAALLRLVK
jgi:hypothetical protein